MARPSFTGVPFSQSLTARVTSTETKECGGGTARFFATVMPRGGALEFVIFNSFQGPFTTWILNKPSVTVLLSTNIVRIALSMLFAVVPAGRVERSNFTNPRLRLLILPLITIVPAFPKFVVGFAKDTYASPVSVAS